VRLTVIILEGEAMVEEISPSLRGKRAPRDT
jgi:hypothetical protein